MKKIVLFNCVLVLLLTIYGCGKDGSNGSAGAEVESVWRYTDAGGGCAGGDLFGDGSLGCLIDIQLTQYTAGSAFLYVSASPDGGATACYYTITLKAPREVHTETYWCSSARYKFVIDNSQTPPTFTANYDNNSNFGDTTAKSFTLVQE